MLTTLEIDPWDGRDWWRIPGDVTLKDAITGANGLLCLAVLGRAVRWRIYARLVHRAAEIFSDTPNDWGKRLWLLDIPPEPVCGCGVVRSGHGTHHPFHDRGW